MSIRYYTYFVPLDTTHYHLIGTNNTNLKSNPLSVSFNKLYEAIYNYFKGLEYKEHVYKVL